MNRTPKGGRRMGASAPLLAALDLLLRETALFAASGFLVLGLSDLAVDLIWIGRTGWRRLRGVGAATGRWARSARRRRRDRLPCSSRLGRGRGDRRHAAPRFGRLGRADYLIFVGCYPNDEATIAAAREAAGPRVRCVVGRRRGRRRRQTASTPCGKRCAPRRRPRAGASRRSRFTMPRTSFIPPM
jgi:adsorption protein B